MYLHIIRNLIYDLLCPLQAKPLCRLFCRYCTALRLLQIFCGLLHILHLLLHITVFVSLCLTRLLCLDICGRCRLYFLIACAFLLHIGNRCCRFLFHYNNRLFRFLYAVLQKCCQLLFIHPQSICQLFNRLLYRICQITYLCIKRFIRQNRHLIRTCQL